MTRLQRRNQTKRLKLLKKFSLLGRINHSWRQMMRWVRSAYGINCRVEIDHSLDGGKVADSAKHSVQPVI